VVEVIADVLRRFHEASLKSRVVMIDMQTVTAGAVLAGKRFAVIVVCDRYWKNNLATLKSLAIKKGGKFVDAIHFIAAGGPVGSMLALMGYLAKGSVQKRYLGIKLPAPNLQPSYAGEAQSFAGELANSLRCRGGDRSHGI
jgi:hypothetical protein